MGYALIALTVMVEGERGGGGGMICLFSGGEGIGERFENEAMLAMSPSFTKLLFKDEYVHHHFPHLLTALHPAAGRMEAPMYVHMHLIFTDTYIPDPPPLSLLHPADLQGSSHKNRQSSLTLT